MVIGKATWNLDRWIEWLYSKEGKSYYKLNYSNYSFKNKMGREPEEGECLDFRNMERKIEDALKIYRDIESGFFEHYLEKIKKFHTQLTALGLSYEVTFHNDKITVLKANKDTYLVPNQFVEVTLFADYSDLPLAELRQIAAGTQDASLTGLVPQNMVNISRKDMEEEIKENKSAINAAEEHIKQVKRGIEEEMAAYKRQLEEQYKPKMELLAKKMEELELMKSEMEKQLFILDTEIYGIRCFLGETIDFVKLRSGKKVNEEEPIVLYQKFRFLDEDLGRFASLYYMGEEASSFDTFEQLLVHREDIFDLFCPAKKSISLVRLTKDKRVYGPSVEVKNVLEAYDALHGGKIGILIRNGENLYVGWTDENRVDIADGNLFLTEKTDIAELDENDIHVDKATSREIIASRYYLLSILQGVLARADIISIPEKVNIMNSKHNPYIIYSLAEGWLENNRFGSFTDILAKYNVPARVGDDILATMHLSDSKGARGRGYNNRTWDVSISDNEIYPINLIEKFIELSLDYTLIDKETKKELEHERTSRRTLKDPSTPEDIEAVYKNIEEYTKNDYKDSDVVFTKRNKREIRYIYVSLEKESYYSFKSGARANFEIFSDEYINLTYLNSIWIEYAISNKKLGGWKIGYTKVNYAYAIRYLNTILQYLREREREENRLIEKYTTLPEEWQIKLSEWKLEKNVHKMTDYQAKRFSKYLHQNL
ncbi:hypothetical protein M2146_002531 [Lachnospiraceae bacterium PF1-22]